MYTGIICPNFSGSTVVGSILHRFYKVQHVGEIWKVFPDSQKEKAFCRECGKADCPYFSTDFKQQLKLSRKKKMIKMLKRKFDAKIILSGDKMPSHFIKYTTVPDRVLILIKNKYAAAYSYAKRNIEFQEDMTLEKAKPYIIQGAEQYFSELLLRVNWVLKNYKKKEYVFASPEVIVEADDELLVSLGRDLFGKKMKIAEDPFDEKFHYIGGNHKVSVGKDPSYFNGTFKADRRYDSFFDSDVKRSIDLVVEKIFCNVTIKKENAVYLEEWLQLLCN